MDIQPGLAAFLAEHQPKPDALGQKNEPSLINPATNDHDLRVNHEGLAHFSSRNPGKALFPGKRGITERLTRFGAEKILKNACKRVGFVGVSTHSFRRTALTQMCSAGIPLRHIQEISGHNDLGTLQRYLEVTPEQRKKAVSVIGF